MKSNRASGLLLLAIVFLIAGLVSVDSRPGAAAPERTESFADIQSPAELSPGDWSQIQGDLYIELTKIDNGDPQKDDAFGWSVSMSGDTAVVGAPEIKEDPANPNSPVIGAAYVFHRDQGGSENWGLVKKLMASDPEDGDKFGSSVAIDGDTIVVGAYSNEDSSPESPLVGGAAYVFERDHGGSDNWGEAARLVVDGIDFSNVFGAAVAISGDTIVVTNPTEVDTFPYNGAAYIYERDLGGAGAWGFAQKLNAYEDDFNEYFGASAAIDGDILIIGTIDGPNEKGAAYIFQRDPEGSGIWNAVTKLTVQGASNDDAFGFSVAIDGATAVIGAPGEDGGPGDPVQNRGAAYIYERDQGGPDVWGLVKLISSSDGEVVDYFGSSVDISDDTIVVGAPNHNGLHFEFYRTGAAYAFERDLGGTANWGESAELIASDAGQDDSFGSVAIDADNLVIGADDATYPGIQQAGAAYVFSHLHVNSQAFLPRVTSCALLFFDDFSNPNSGWPKGEFDDTLYQYLNGEYRLLMQGEFTFGAASPGDLYVDFLATVSVRNHFDSPGMYGLLFGFSGIGNTFYTFEIDRDKHYEVWQRSNAGGGSMLADGISPALKAGTAVNVIAVERQGDYVTIFANGTLIETIELNGDPGIRSVGVYASPYTSDQTLDIRFDDYKVEPPGCGIGADAPGGDR